MILIADSGSTKTSWRLVAKNGEIQQFTSVGFNPLHEAENSMISTIQASVATQIIEKNAIEDVFFYSTGCGTAPQAKKMKFVLKSCFANANIEVFDDMIGAARSLCNKNEGIVGILGTGSNSCYYDGEKITQTKGGLGLTLGDEGSGAYLGQKLLSDFLNEEMPHALAQKLQKRYHLEKATIFENVYAKPYPNRYLAQFAKFLFDHKQEFYCTNLVYQAMLTFFEKTICKYPNYQATKVHFTGSIAFWFSAYLQKAAAEKNVNLGIVAEEPIAGLLLYHTKN
jgi:glucosamine kinase